MPPSTGVAGVQLENEKNKTVTHYVSQQSHSAGQRGQGPRRALSSPGPDRGHVLTGHHRAGLYRCRRAASARAHRVAPHRDVGQERRDCRALHSPRHQALYRGQVAHAHLGRPQHHQAHGDRGVCRHL